jgi:hypothetical protein
MHRIALLISALVGVGTAHAELRAILLEVGSPYKEVRPGFSEYAAPRVNVYSDEEKERRRTISIADASALLKAARGWHSMVDVKVLYHQSIRTSDLIALLDGMKDNLVLRLSRVDDADSAIGKRELDRFRELGAK